MEDSEKMASLKRVYADIILNTAKEAAARILVSERRALGYHQEVFTVKDEALGMLVRLKQMMDIKISEAEIVASGQKKRIEELEAQLHQSEDIIRDLRADLKCVQSELEKVKSNQVRPLGIEMDCNCKLSAYPSMGSRRKPISSDPYNVRLDQRHTGNCCCLVGENTIDKKQLSDLPKNIYTGNGDLRSSIMRSKEPDLYRNGCTQRIRALERNLTEVETAERTCTLVHSKDNRKDLIKNPTKLDNLAQQERNSVKDQAVKIFKFSTKKRSRRTYSFNENDTNACDQSNLSRCNTYPCIANGSSEAGEDKPKIVDEEAKRNLESHLSSLHLTDLVPATQHKDGSGSHNEAMKAEVVQNAAEDIKLVDGSVSTGQDKIVAECSVVPDCEPDKDESTCKMTTGAPTQVVNDRFLKYTFQRKRKRDAMSSPDGKAVPENKSSLKTSSGEKINNAPVAQKSKLIVESSRESRRMMQVARQLIALSEKKWWQ